MNPQNELEAKYPYMFQKDKHIGINIARGWFPMFSELCAEIDHQLGDDKQGFFWRQVKEKFGSGRFYYAFGSTKQPMRIDIVGDDGVMSFKAESKPRKPTSEKQQIQKRIGEMISKAEALTHSTCIVCGRTPAQVDGTNGYLLVLCDMHAKQRKQNDNSVTAKDIYFDE